MIHETKIRHTSSYTASPNISSGISSSYGFGLSDPANQKENQKDLGNININSSNIVSTRDAVNMISANDVNLLTSSSFFEQTDSSNQFSVYARLGINYNFKESWKSIEKLKDVKLKNASKN